MNPIHLTSKLGSRVTASAWAGGLCIWLLGCGAPTEDVRGRAIVTRIAEDGSGTPETTSWYGRTVEALSPDGKGYRRFAADVDVRGVFHIPDVPAGPYWLAIPDEVTAIPDEAKLFAWTDGRELDVGYTRIGSGAPADTIRQQPIELTGLSPIQVDDRIETYSTGHTWHGLQGITPPGATSGTIKNVPIRNRSEPGEQLVVKQWRSTAQGGLDVEAVVRAASVPAPDATTGALSIALSDAVPRTLDMQLDTAAFSAELGTPSAEQRLDVQISAMGLPREPMAPQERLLHVYARDALRAGTLSGLAYTDPHPAAWTRRYDVKYTSGRTYPLPNETALKASCATGFHVQGETRALAQGAVRPRLSLPQGFTIDDQDALQEGLRVSASPTIRWRAPRIGQATFYLLRLLRIGVLPDRATPENVAASFITTETEVNIPEGVLQPGVQYVLQLIAIASTDVDAATAPRRASLFIYLADTAQVCSGALTSI